MGLRFTCPSCGSKFRPVEGMAHATQVVRRTCRGCRETWQLKVSRLTGIFSEGITLDQAEFTFIERRPKAK